MVSFAIFQVASTVEFSIMNYRLEGDVILLYEQPLLKFPTYHELINTFVMKKYRKKCILMNELHHRKEIYVTYNAYYTVQSLHGRRS